MSLSPTQQQAREARRLDDEFDAMEEEAWNYWNEPSKCPICKETGGDHTLSCPTRWYR